MLSFCLNCVKFFEILACKAQELILSENLPEPEINFPQKTSALMETRKKRMKKDAEHQKKGKREEKSVKCLTESEKKRPKD